MSEKFPEKTLPSGAPLPTKEPRRGLSWRPNIGSSEKGMQDYAADHKDVILDIPEAEERAYASDYDETKAAKNKKIAVEAVWQFKQSRDKFEAPQKELYASYTEGKDPELVARDSIRSAKMYRAVADKEADEASSDYKKERAAEEKAAKIASLMDEIESIK